MTTHPIIIIGAGPAGLMAAQRLAEAGKEVHIYEKNKAAARKFLVAGHGGFNLTHNEDIEDFILKYSHSEIQEIVKEFTNQNTVSWLESIGIPTYIGSSGKIFPAKNIKPIQVLQAWLKKLEELSVSIHYEHRFIDFDHNQVTLEFNGDQLQLQFSHLILALGGGSWQKTGSDAKWISILGKKNIQISPLSSANSGYNTISNYAELEGEILKNITVKFQNTSKKGEIVFTKYGIEGSPIYYLNRFTRPCPFPLTIHIDLKPQSSEEDIIKLLSANKKINEILKGNLNLSKTAISLIKKLNKDTYLNPALLAQKIKNYPIEVDSLRPIDEVISTAGGIIFDELQSSLALKKYNNVFCIGEMLDWEAPTGGYLLQACFSMGEWCAREIIGLSKT